MTKENAAPGISPGADCRDPENYKHLLELDRAGWAWEWLKRNPDFIAAIERVSRKTHSTDRRQAERRGSRDTGGPPGHAL